MRILIIDDEPLICRALKTLLEQQDHQVDTACRALDGAAKLEALAYDLALIDVELGSSITGMDLAEHARHAGIPPVLMTGWDPDDLRARGYEVIQKPDLFDYILRVIARLEGRKSDEDTDPQTPRSHER